MSTELQIVLVVSDSIVDDLSYSLPHDTVGHLHATLRAGF